MPDRSPVTHESYDLALAGLQGQVLSEVVYHRLALDGLDWDAGRYHQATMGVELVTEDAHRFFATWGDAFGRFGLELMDNAASSVLANETVSRNATSHPWWRPFTAQPISAGVVWRTGHVDGDDPAPVALELSAAEHQVWVVSAEDTQAGRFLLGLDAVIVTADPDFAGELGLIADER